LSLLSGTNPSSSNWFFFFYFFCSASPSLKPSGSPTLKPTNVPSVFPTKKPTYSPTRLPTRLPTVTRSFVPTVHHSAQPTLPTSQPSSSPTTKPSSTFTTVPDASSGKSLSTLATISSLVHMIWPIIVIGIGLLIILFGCLLTCCCVRYKKSKSEINNDRRNNTPTLSSTYRDVHESEIDRMPSLAPSSSFAYRTVVLNNIDKESCQPSAPTAPPLSLENISMEEQIPVYQLTAIGYNSLTTPMSVTALAIPSYDVSLVNQQFVSYSTSSAANL
jgi:hypothetical protein